MNKNYFRAILISATFVAATASWLCEYRAVEVAGASSWGWPMFWFSLYFIFLCLDLILFPNIISVEIIAVATFAISLVFAFTFWHAIFLLLSSLLFLSALQNIKKDFEMNVKVSIWKSFHMGKIKIIVAISLLIASQYYAMLSGMRGPIIPPKLDTSSITEKWVYPALSKFDPDFASSQAKGMINGKINNFLQPQSVSETQSNPTPLIFSIVLFLTVFSLGSFLLPFWLVILMGLFWLCKKKGIVEIKKIMVEREIIV